MQEHTEIRQVGRRVARGRGRPGDPAARVRVDRDTTTNAETA
ncbi:MULTISPECIES: hypothetical protein [unclassified Blastococcus]